MNTEATTSPEPAPSKPKRRWVWSWGPGLVFALAAIGPSDFVSNSVTGAAYGYSLLWTLPLIAAARYFILEASARYVLVTGESIFVGYGRCGRWVVWLIFAASLLRQHFSVLYMTLLMGSALQMVMPLPGPWAETTWSLLCWSSGFSLMYWGRYEGVEKWCWPLLFLLAGCLGTVAVWSQPDPSTLLQGLLLPSIPSGHGLYSSTWLVMALAGSGASSTGNFKYAAFVHEKGWRDSSHLPKQRVDLLLSLLGMVVLQIVIQVAAAGTLKPMGVTIEAPQDLVPLFSQTMGDAGRIILGLGLWAVVYSSYVGSTTGSGLVLGDIYRNFIRPSDETTVGPGQPAGKHSFRAFVSLICVTSLYGLVTDWKPIWLVLLASALLVVLLPVFVVVLMRLTNDKKLMGEYVNGWVTNAALTFVVVMAAFLTYQNALNVWTDLGVVF